MFLPRLANNLLGAPKKLLFNHKPGNNLISSKKFFSHNSEENYSGNTFRNIYLGGVGFTGMLGLVALCEPGETSYNDPAPFNQLMFVIVMSLIWPIGLPLFIFVSYQMIQEEEERKKHERRFRYRY